MKVIIEKIQQPTSDVKVFNLVPLPGASIPQFSPGAHIDVYLDNGLIRQYSICNNPNEKDHYQIAVLLHPYSRGGSKYIHENLIVGDLLKISEPRNLFKIAKTQEKVLLFAGGIGVTPLISMAEFFLDNNINFTFYYFCRTPEDIIFKDRLCSFPFKDKVHFFHIKRKDIIAILPVILAEHPQNIPLYTCGPLGLMNSIFEAALENGWITESLYKEPFEAITIESNNNISFQIQIASTNEILDIPKEKSITQVLEDNNYFIPVSCEQGICGTCVTKVLQGVAEHNDSFLTDNEKNNLNLFTPCCSRSKTNLLVLDI